MGRKSRVSHRQAARYNRVQHTQGSMITDADLNESQEIRETAFREVNHDAMGGGVPEDGGAVTLTANTLEPGLRPGRIYAAGVADKAKGQDIVYAEGLRGNLAAATGEVINGSMDLFEKQADLPMGPALPKGAKHVIYADLWERSIYPAEDPYLTDPGLHGAETAYRSRIMTQIKAAPAAHADEIRGHSGGYPHHGTGRLSVTANEADVHTNECDPCAGTLTSEQSVPNALFRLQIVFVEGPADNPTRIGLAWSSENAGEIVPVVLKDQLRRDPAVYEYFSEITESHSGVFADSTDARHASFTDSLDAAPPRPNDHNGQPWPFIRRWDGYAEIDLTAAKIDRKLGKGFVLKVGAAQLKLETETFNAVLKLRNRKFLKGDYWLIELRRFAAKPDRIRLVSPLPFGIRHFYLVLFHTDADGKPIPVDDDQKRRLSYPALSDMRATHVGYDPKCPDFYTGVDNVQEALDRICDLSAEDVDYTPECPDFYPGVETVKGALDRFCTLDAGDIPFDPAGCPDLYAGASTVEDALYKLCGREFSAERILRYLFDWGVVCGIKAKLLARGTDRIEVTPGEFLDPAGRLVEYRGDNLLLRELPPHRVHFESDAQLEAAVQEEQACLAVALSGDGVGELHLVPRDLATAHIQKGFFERVVDCMQKQPKVRFDAATLELDHAETRAFNLMVMGHTQSQSLGTRARLDAAGYQAAENVNHRLLAAYKAVAGDTDTRILEEKWQGIDAEFADRNIVGDAADNHRAIWASTKFGTLYESELERRRRCLCEALLPPCPPQAGPGPLFVPIACLKGSWDGHLYLDEVCIWCCRKQAITLRSMEYYFGHLIRTWSSSYAGSLCCPDPHRQPDPFPDPRPQPKPKYPPELELDWTEFGVRPDIYVNGIGGLSPTKPDYAPHIDIKDMSSSTAEHVLAGYGVEIGARIDLDDDDAVDTVVSKITNVSAEERLKGLSLAPGDKVALIERDGVAFDYVKLEAGDGKLPYEKVDLQDPAREIDLRTVERVEWAVAASEGLKTKADEVKAAYAAAADTLAESAAEVDTIRAEKAALSNELTALRQEVETVLSARDATREASETLRRDVEHLSQRHTEISSAISNAGAELEVIRGERDAAVEAINALKTELGNVTAARGDAAAALAETRAELALIREERNDVLDTLNKDREAMAAARAEHDEFLRRTSRSMESTRRALEATAAERAELASTLAADREALEERRRSEITLISRMREAYSPAVLEKDREKATMLVEYGVGSVAELANLKPALSRRLVNDGIYEAEALGELRTAARNFIKVSDG